MEIGTAKESHPVRAVNRACGPFLLLLVASCAGGPGGAPEPGSRADDEKKAAQQAYQQELTRLGREAAARMLLRALYSPWQLREQMTWFWMNHFNVFQYKANLRVLVADYEERAIRPHALGRFREL